MQSFATCSICRQVQPYGLDAAICSMNYMPPCAAIFVSSMHYMQPWAAIVVKYSHVQHALSAPMCSHSNQCSMGYLPPCTARCDNAGICSIYRLHSCAATWPKHSHLQYEARATCNHALCAEMQICAASTLCSHVQPHALDAATYSMQDTWHALYALNALACSMHFM
jgi:nitroreductase